MWGGRDEERARKAIRGAGEQGTGGVREEVARLREAEASSAHARERPHAGVGRHGRRLGSAEKSHRQQSAGKERCCRPLCTQYDNHHLRLMFGNGGSSLV